MTEAVLEITQGDSDTFIETAYNLPVSSGYEAKLYIIDMKDRNKILGTIEGETTLNVARYPVTPEVSKGYKVGRHRFETKWWHEDTNQHTPIREGIFIINKTIETDPS